METPVNDPGQRALTINDQAFLTNDNLAIRGGIPVQVRVTDPPTAMLTVAP